MRRVVATVLVLDTDRCSTTATVWAKFNVLDIGEVSHSIVTTTDALPRHATVWPATIVIEGHFSSNNKAANAIADVIRKETGQTPTITTKPPGFMKQALKARAVALFLGHETDDKAVVAAQQQYRQRQQQQRKADQPMADDDKAPWRHYMVIVATAGPEWLFFVNEERYRTFGLADSCPFDYGNAAVQRTIASVYARHYPYEAILVVKTTNITNADIGRMQRNCNAVCPMAHIAVVERTESAADANKVYAVVTRAFHQWGRTKNLGVTTTDDDDRTAPRVLVLVHHDAAVVDTERWVMYDNECRANGVFTPHPVHVTSATERLTEAVGRTAASRGVGSQPMTYVLIVGKRDPNMSPERLKRALPSAFLHVVTAEQPPPRVDVAFAAAMYEKHGGQSIASVVTASMAQRDATEKQQQEPAIPNDNDTLIAELNKKVDSLEKQLASAKKLEESLRENHTRATKRADSNASLLAHAGTECDRLKAELARRDAARKKIKGTRRRIAVVVHRPPVGWTAYVNTTAGAATFEAVGAPVPSIARFVEHFNMTGLHTVLVLLYPDISRLLNVNYFLDTLGKKKDVTTALQTCRIGVEPPATIDGDYVTKVLASAGIALIPNSHPDAETEALRSQVMVSKKHEERDAQTIDELRTEVATLEKQLVDEKQRSDANFAVYARVRDERDALKAELGRRNETKRVAQVAGAIDDDMQQLAKDVTALTTQLKRVRVDDDDTVWIKVDGVRYPASMDEHGVLRFRADPITKKLVDMGVVDLNDLVMKQHARDWKESGRALTLRELIEFNVRLGHSVSGFAELWFVRDHGVTIGIPASYYADMPALTTIDDDNEIPASYYADMPELTTIDDDDDDNEIPASYYADMPALTTTKANWPSEKMKAIIYGYGDRKTLLQREVMGKVDNDSDESDDGPPPLECVDCGFKGDPKHDPCLEKKKADAQECSCDNNRRCTHAYLIRFKMCALCGADNDGLCAQCRHCGPRSPWHVNHAPGCECAYRKWLEDNEMPPLATDDDDDDDDEWVTIGDDDADDEKQQ